MAKIEFLDNLFGTETGYVYLPTQKPGFRWNQNFFAWPEERQRIISFITKKTQTHEIYVSPSLFTQRRISPKTFKGTQWVWAEFDGELPTEIPIQPTIRIQSSTENHAHWYWRLSEFITDPASIEEVTKRIAYAYNADLSGWDYQQVLRIPGTYNHKRKIEVKLLEFNGSNYALNEFYSLPAPPVAAIKLQERTIEDLPKIDPLIARYQWGEATYDLFCKAVEYPNRSSALTRLAYDCVEMGMANVEVLAILADADSRWKKFTRRTDRLKRLLGILEYVRAQKAVAEQVTESLSIYRFQDFLNTEINLEWIIPGILPVAGSGIIFGPPGVGKSTMSLRMGMSIATGSEQFLKWSIEKQLKVLFLSLEMPHDELKHFIHDMAITTPVAEQLQSNFFIWPIGHAYPLDIKEYQEEVIRFIDLYGINLIIVDSLAVGMYGSVSSDDDIKRLNSFLNEDLRKERKCGYWFVHHPHKPSKDSSSDSFYAMFGSIYIANNAQTIINLSKADPKREDRFKMDIQKSRLSMDQNAFYITRTNNRDFIMATDQRIAKTKIREEKREDVRSMLNIGSKIAKD